MYPRKENLGYRRQTVTSYTPSQESLQKARTLLGEVDKEFTTHKISVASASQQPYDARINEELQSLLRLGKRKRETPASQSSEQNHVQLANGSSSTPQPVHTPQLLTINANHSITTTHSTTPVTLTRSKFAPLSTSPQSRESQKQLGTPNTYSMPHQTTIPLPQEKKTSGFTTGSGKTVPMSNQVQTQIAKIRGEVNDESALYHGPSAQENCDMAAQNGMFSGFKTGSGTAIFIDEKLKAKMEQFKQRIAQDDISELLKEDSNVVPSSAAATPISTNSKISKTVLPSRNEGISNSNSVIPVSLSDTGAAQKNEHAEDKFLHENQEISPQHTQKPQQEPEQKECCRNDNTHSKLSTKMQSELSKPQTSFFSGFKTGSGTSIFLSDKTKEQMEKFKKSIQEDEQQLAKAFKAELEKERPDKQVRNIQNQEENKNESAVNTVDRLENKKGDTPLAKRMANNKQIKKDSLSGTSNNSASTLQQSTVSEIPQELSEEFNFDFSQDSAASPQTPLLTGHYQKQQKKVSDIIQSAPPGKKSRFLYPGTQQQKNTTPLRHNAINAKFTPPSSIRQHQFHAPSPLQGQRENTVLGTRTNLQQQQSFQNKKRQENQMAKAAPFPEEHKQERYTPRIPPLEVPEGKGAIEWSITQGKRPSLRDLAYDEAQASRCTPRKQLSCLPYLTPAEAETYTFPGHSSYNELRAAIIATGAKEHAVPTEWVRNHYKWIVWKLACFERRFPHLLRGKYLLWEHALSQLQYRYSVEYLDGRRSALKKIIERDDTASRFLILCVSGISAIKEENNSKEQPTASHSSSPFPATTAQRFQLELTDGWYSIKAFPDEKLNTVISQNKIYLGKKLCVCGAQLCGSEQGEDVLQSKSFLRIFYNGTRRAPWFARLGFQPHATFSVSLRSVINGGGIVPAIDVAVQRIYQTAYLEENGGQRRVLNENEYRRLAAEQEEKIEKQGYAVLEELAAEGVGDDQHNVEFDKRIEAYKNSLPRMVPFTRVKITDCPFTDPLLCASPASAVLTVWGASELDLEEGDWVRIFGANAHQSRYNEPVLQLTTNKLQAYKKPATGGKKETAPLYKPRFAEQISNLINVADGEDVDLCGVVLVYKAPTERYHKRWEYFLFIADDSENICAIHVFTTTKTFPMKVEPKVGEVLCISGLVAGRYTPSLNIFTCTANETTAFTRTPRANFLVSAQHKVAAWKAGNKETVQLCIDHANAVAGGAVVTGASGATVPHTPYQPTPYKPAASRKQATTAGFPTPLQQQQRQDSDCVGQPSTENVLVDKTTTEFKEEASLLSAYLSVKSRLQLAEEEIAALNARITELEQEQQKNQAISFPNLDDESTEQSSLTQMSITSSTETEAETGTETQFSSSHSHKRKRSEEPTENIERR